MIRGQPFCDDVLFDLKKIRFRGGGGVRNIELRYCDSSAFMPKSLNIDFQLQILGSNGSRPDPKAF